MALLIWALNNWPFEGILDQAIWVFLYFDLSWLGILCLFFAINLATVLVAHRTRKPFDLSQLGLPVYEYEELEAMASRHGEPMPKDLRPSYWEVMMPPIFLRGWRAFRRLF